MSDLISRSALIEELEKYKFSCLTHEIERDYVKETVIDFVKTQPVAYDVDAVVKELEDSVVCGMFGAMFGKSDAEIIDIIKAGGVK